MTLTERFPCRPFRVRRRTGLAEWILLGFLVTGLAGCNGRSSDVDPTEQTPPVEEREDAAALLNAGKLSEAEQAVRRALLADPTDDALILTAGRIEAAKGNHEAAAERVASISLKSPLGSDALEFRLQQLVASGAVEESVAVVLAAIEELPERSSWRHLAWSLLNRVGRREEASRQAEYLCRLGQVTETELLSLVRRTESFPPQLKANQSPEKFFEPGMGLARWHFTQLEYRAALQLLQPQVDDGFDSAAANAFYGRLLAETQRFEEIPAWHADCDANVRSLGDYWAALGTYLFDQREYEASARALLEAVYLNPTDRISIQRLSKVFAAMGRRDDEEQFRHRGIQLATLERHSEALMLSSDDLNARQALTRAVLELGRPFEALAWTLTMLPPNAIAPRNRVVQQRMALLKDPEVRTMASESSLIGIDREQFDMQSALALLNRDSANGPARGKSLLPDEPLAQPELVDVAKSVGLQFQWYPDLELDVSSIPIHESVGGGIAVIDFDLDGWPDVYLAQGSGEPPSAQCTRSNVLFRNDKVKHPDADHHQVRFADVTAASLTEDTNYGSGLTSGDVNQDGFPDLFLGSLGHNRLMINNGDGTFRDATESLGRCEDRFTSSLAIGDVNGDGLPDLFEAAYIEMEGAFKLPDIDTDGREKQPSPLAHFAQSDRWFKNQGDGRFEVHEIDRSIAKPGTSLGLMVTDFDGDGKNEVFVGNDVRPNHFLLQQADGELVNAADIKGVANGYSGNATGCMGITHGDFNHDGRIDLHITNFSEESANLYVQVGTGEFTDLAVRYGVDQISLPFVGFGTKAVDVDRNGWLDLLVTNGHIFDMRFVGEAFQMPPQFLAGKNLRFEETAVSDSSGYWDGAYLGRTMANIDFNRDGAVDFLIGHLDHPLALLENRTVTAGRSIQFELLGTHSERDAIGARVVVRADGHSYSNWVTAGDGYFCNDEAVLDFGLGTIRTIEDVQIFWPSGKQQRFAGPQAGRRYLAVENSDTLFER